MLTEKFLKKVLDKPEYMCYNTYRKKEINQPKGIDNMNKYNLNRIERHYMTEVMLTFEWKNGREMTAEEFEKAVEKMRKKG